MANPKMAYYGPYTQSGHFFHYEDGSTVFHAERQLLPWKDYEIDGVLQPGCGPNVSRWDRREPEVEGEARIHFKDGWTAISFWDRTIDKRGGCNSTYMAEGIFTFEEMVALAKTRFAVRWNKMQFSVKLVT